MNENHTLEELDLAILNMHSEHEQSQVAEALRSLPGVESVRTVPRGAWLAYRSSSISKEELCEALHHMGFRASVFQDSKSGKAGKSTG